MNLSLNYSHYKITQHKKALRAGFCGVILLTQPGCIVGAALQNVPLLLSGIMIALDGSFGLTSEPSHYYGMGWDAMRGGLLTLFVGGVVLDEDQNLVLSELRELPRGDANFNNNIGITASDVDAYNDSLNEISAFTQELQADLRSLWHLASQNTLSLKSLESAHALKILGKYHFYSSKDVCDFFYQEKINPAQVAHFARMAQVDETSIKILFSLLIDAHY